MVIEGTVQKKIERVEWYHSKHFHEKFVKMNFSEAKMLIYEAKGAKDPQHVFKFEQINGVSAIEDKATEPDEIYQNRQDPAAGHRSQSFINKMARPSSGMKRSSSVTKDCQWLFPFELRTDKKSMILHCQSKEDRNCWLRIFKIIQHMSMHNFQHSTFNPFEYEAKFMLRTLPTNYTSSLVKDVSTNSLGLENGRLINKNNYFQEHIENDFIVYKSLNMKRDRNIVCGKLLIKDNSKKGILGTNVTYEIFFMQLDFWQKILKCSYDYNFMDAAQNARETLLTGKGIPFVEVMKAEFDAIEETDEVQFRNKFNLYTKDFNFELYVKTNKEREYWVEAFCRAIETKHKNAVTNWAEESKLFNETKKSWLVRKDKITQSKLLRQVEMEVDGMMEFKSANMYVNCNQIEGYLLKMISNKKVYHTKPFHKKYFQIVYETGSIKIFNTKEEKTPTRVIPLQSLHSVTVLSARSAGENDCPWKFGFTMKTLECTMQLHCAT